MMPVRAISISAVFDLSVFDAEAFSARDAGMATFDSSFDASTSGGGGGGDGGGGD